LHFLVVLLVIAYFWLLAKKVAKPKAFKPGALWLRLLAWAWAVFFGVWVVGGLAITIRTTASRDTSGWITVLILSLLMPFLLALSVRWARSLKSENLNSP
jgi:hypothetical protein